MHPGRLPETRTGNSSLAQGLEQSKQAALPKICPLTAQQSQSQSTELGLLDLGKLEKMELKAVLAPVTQGTSPWLIVLLC